MNKETALTHIRFKLDDLQIKIGVLRAHDELLLDWQYDLNPFRKQALKELMERVFGEVECQ